VLRGRKSGYAPVGMTIHLAGNSFRRDESACSPATALHGSAALPFVIPTRISCHAAPDRAACAPFRKERRMKCINAMNLNRKSGGAQPRDLRFSGPFLDMFFETSIGNLGTRRNVTSCRRLRFYLGSRTAKRSAWSIKTRRKSPVVRTPSNPFTYELFSVVVLKKDTPDNSSEPIFTT
jgi:hypothetical protein